MSDSIAIIKCSRFKMLNLYNVRIEANRNAKLHCGCTNLKASAFKEHASSLMHQKSMVLYKKSQSVPVTEYAPIVKALSTIDERTEVHKYHSSYIKHMSDQKYKLSDQYCHDLTQMSGQCYILIISTVSNRPGQDRGGIGPDKIHAHPPVQLMGDH